MATRTHRYKNIPMAELRNAYCSFVKTGEIDMTEYELGKICENIDCDCNCMKCPFFAKHIESETEE